MISFFLLNFIILTLFLISCLSVSYSYNIWTSTSILINCHLNLWIELFDQMFYVYQIWCWLPSILLAKIPLPFYKIQSATADLLFVNYSFYQIHILIGTATLSIGNLPLFLNRELLYWVGAIDVLSTVTCFLTMVLLFKLFFGACFTNGLVIFVDCFRFRLWKVFYWIDVLYWKEILRISVWYLLILVVLVYKRRSDSCSSWNFH